MFRLLGVRTAGVLLGAVALFAVVGFAASFAINLAPTVNAEGETLVVTCSDLIKVDKIDKWRDPGEGGQPGDGGFYVERVRVVGLANYAPECNQKWFYIVLTGSGGQQLAIDGAQWLGTGNVDLNFAAANIPVADLHDIHVLISDTPQKP